MFPMTAREEEAITRFQFGENWTRFLSVVDEDRIAQAAARLSAGITHISIVIKRDFFIMTPGLKTI